MEFASFVKCLILNNTLHNFTFYQYTNSHFIIHSFAHHTLFKSASMNSFTSVSTSDQTHQSIAYFSSASIEPQTIVLEIINSSILRQAQMGQQLINKDSPQVFKKEVAIEKRSFILMDRQNSKTKIVGQQKIAKKIIQQQNFQFICEIQPTFNHRRQTAFILSRKQTLASLSKEKDLSQSSEVFFSLKNFDNHHSYSHKLKNQNIIKFGKLNTEAIKACRPIQFVQWTQRIYRQDHFIEGQCRICLLNQGLDECDNILSPCRCSGSCSYIHLQCLKNWISQKIQTVKVKNKLRTFDMAKFECQICKSPYPKRVQICKRFYQMIPEVQLQTGSLILQKIYPQQNSKNIHFITLQKGESLTIGRNFANQLILDDMSVSRFHARIMRSSAGVLSLQDNNSKFGTFANLSDPLPLSRQTTLLTNRFTFKFGVDDKHKKKQGEEKGYLTDNQN